MKSNLNFLVLGDLHGEKPQIHIDMTKIDAIISPGDVCGDDIRPYIKKIIEQETKNKTELDIDKICSKKEQKKLEKISLKKGRETLELLNSFEKPVFIVPGNWDHTKYRDGLPRSNNNSWKNLILGLKNIIDIEHRTVNFNGITLIGHGSTSSPEPIIQIPPEEFKSEEEFGEYVYRYHYFQKVYERLTNLFLKSKNPILFLTHNVPYDTKLDLICEKKNYANGKHYGSIISRKLINKYQPLLCLGGHIHEGYGKDKVDKTLCINGGFGGDVNTIIEIDVKNKKIKKVEFLGKNKL